jgi:single-stranded DNA-binding protein
MSTKIDCALYGTVVKEPRRRTSTKGKDWLSFLVRVGEGDDATWAQVSVFGDCVEQLGELADGSRVYVEGTIRLNSWTAGAGELKHGLAVNSFKAQHCARVGEQKKRSTSSKSAATPKNGRTAEFDDELAF